MIRHFLRLFVLTSVSASVFFAIVKICGSFDGSVAWQLAGLLGLAWSSAGLSIAGHAIFRSQPTLIVFSLVLVVSQVFTGGYMIPPDALSGTQIRFLRFTPAFATQEVMDTSFLWKRELSGDVISNHHQSYRNLDPERYLTTGEIYSRPAILPLFVPFFWGLTGFGAAYYTLLRKYARFRKSTNGLPHAL